MSEFLTIARAVYGGLSQRKAAALHGVSRNTVSLYLRHAREQGWLTLEDLENIDESEAAAISPRISSTSKDTSFAMPDFDHVHAELAKPDVTLKVLWNSEGRRRPSGISRLLKQFSPAKSAIPSLLLLRFLLLLVVASIASDGWSSPEGVAEYPTSAEPRPAS